MMPMYIVFLLVRHGSIDNVGVHYITITYKGNKTMMTMMEMPMTTICMTISTIISSTISFIEKSNAMRRRLASSPANSFSQKTFIPLW